MYPIFEETKPNKQIIIIISLKHEKTIKRNKKIWKFFSPLSSFFKSFKCYFGGFFHDCHCYDVVIVIIIVIVFFSPFFFCANKPFQLFKNSSNFFVYFFFCGIKWKISSKILYSMYIMKVIKLDKHRNENNKVRIYSWGTVVCCCCFFI